MMHGGGGGLRYCSGTGDKSEYTEQTRLYPWNVLKFRARLDTVSGTDVHREFSGAYMPRFRTMYINEIKDKQRLGMKGISLVPYIPEEVHHKPDGDYFYTEDFEVGVKLNLGGGKAPRDLETNKVFIITDVDKSQLKYSTLPAPSTNKPVNPSTEDLLQRLRNAVAKRSGKLGIKEIGRHFDHIDTDGDRTLKRAEFKRALSMYSMDLTDDELNKLTTIFDKDNNGKISFKEFLEAVRGPMPEHRALCIASAFKKIDYNKDGVLTIDDIRQFYCAKYHPKVLSGEATEDEVLRKFLDGFDSKDKDGIVTYAEFCDYYSGVSANIDDDDTFVFMMERAWNLDNRNESATPFR